MIEVPQWQIRRKPPRPVSATSGWVAVAAALTFVATFYYLRLHRPFDNPADRVIVLSAMTAAAIFLVDQFLKRREALPVVHAGSYRRSAVKFLGLMVTIGLIALTYMILPEYRTPFYQRYYGSLGEIALPFVVLAYPYIFLTDRRMVHPEDGLWMVGKAALFQFSKVDRPLLRQYFLGWAVKAFFLPLMFGYACDNMNNLLYINYAQAMHSFKGFYDVTYDSLYFIDVVIAMIGYLFSLRLFEKHIRSVEPTTSGWVSALMCYAPFWGLVSHSYITYDTGKSWESLMTPRPWLYNLWAVLILGTVFVYAWATVSFGCRFSNLTNRGIITNGPYRFTKHPAYIAKNLSYWMISLPFIGTDFVTAARACILLLLLNTIYFVRARTEERHLSLDPTYRDYAAWIADHGIFRRIRLRPPTPLSDYVLQKNSLVGRFDVNE